MHDIGSGRTTTNGAAASPARPGLLAYLSRVSFGMTVLTIILVYASLGSALPQLRGVLEMTEMEVFRHWLFTALTLLFTLSLCLATWRRIRWNVINLGVLTVHTGLLLLIGGALIYFGTKVEGDVVLLSPRIKVVRDNGQPIPGGEIAARADEVWERNMPALGGAVSVTVVETVREGLEEVARAKVRVSGDVGTRDVEVVAGGPPVAIGDRLALQLETFPASTSFYDNETAALHYRALGDAGLRQAPIEGLPHYRERYLAGESIADRSGDPVPSKRTWPHIPLGSSGKGIPTDWFEPWRMPIALETDLPFDITVTGYLPYIAGMQESAVAGGAEVNPVAQIILRFGEESRSSWLWANDPIKSLFQIGVPVEFRWVADAAERDALLTPIHGPHELVVETIDPPTTNTYTIRQGQEIEVAGTGYRLTVDQLVSDWPLMTPGFDGARSAVALVSAVGPDKSFQRTVVERFPHLSQDINEAGTRLREGLYDDNIRMHYRSAPRGKLMLVAGPDLEPQLGVYDVGGALQTYPLRPGQVATVPVAGVRLDVALPKLLTHARAARVPVVEDLERRRPNVGRQLSAVRLHLAGRDALAGWEETRWMSFSTYPHVDAQPIVVRPPGHGRGYELIYSRLRRDLGAEVAPGNLTVQFFPGRRSVESWRSEFLVRENDEVRVGSVQTNDTYAIENWTFFQSGAAKDHWSFTILGVGNRQGIITMTVGCVLITLGCFYAFYVKPILRKRKQAAVQQQVAELAGRRAQPVPAPEVVET